ncbi:hypothetical protein QJS04_geneDACA007006 [Acorus gramineus]|uniref:Uncharacterized protein n=1 Tax=Acorus gramineus TaxID=55184 RepID=A0AAV9A2J5_ACOGR|nr:hypothetical protein QJS04_geneDACA007006 [Acorus gramineus]
MPRPTSLGHHHLALTPPPLLQQAPPPLEEVLAASEVGVSMKGGGGRGRLNRASQPRWWQMGVARVEDLTVGGRSDLRRRVFYRSPPPMSSTVKRKVRQKQVLEAEQKKKPEWTDPST